MGENRIRKGSAYRGSTFRSIGVGLILAAGAVRADFAPLKPGNLWVYQGSYSAYSGVGAASQGREWLSLEIVDTKQGGDTSYFRVRLRDSVYARESRSTYSGSLQPLPDTVL